MSLKRFVHGVRELFNKEVMHGRKLTSFWRKTPYDEMMDFLARGMEEEEKAEKLERKKAQQPDTHGR